MGVLGIVPFLLKKCPTAIENIPNRFQALEGKTIAIDGTLITQRLFYAPDSRPHRHVLGWYQLIQELRQNKINIICVFDGKHRISAKRNEVERRRSLRVQAQARGAWEKSRHERLLSLTQALRGLEGLSVDHQQEALKTLQIDPQSPSPPGATTPGSTDLHQVDTTVYLGQEPSAGANPLTSGSASLEGTNLDQTSGHDPGSTEPELLNQALSTTSGLFGDEWDTKNKYPGPRPLDDVIYADGLEDTVPQTAPPLPKQTEATRKLKDAGNKSPSDTDETLNLGVPETLFTSFKDQPGDQSRTSLDIGVVESTMESTDKLSNTEDRLSPQWTEAKLRIDSLQNEDSKALTYKILDLFDHYNRTTALSPDGTIPALGMVTNAQDTPVIPISRVQLKYTQEEAKLWKQLVALPETPTVDLAQVVEMVEQFASVELPKDETPSDEITLEEEAEPPISERSAKLEEQSGLMAASFARRANPPTPLTYAESRLILEAMGIPCVQSSLPYEAEALACSLVLNGLADFVGSEDTDVLMYNAPLLRGMTNQKVPLQIIPSSIETNLGLSRAAFVDAAILMGTDFVKRVGGVGPTTAWRLMHQYGSIEVMLERESKFRPPDVSEYLEQVKVARMIFGTIPPAPAAEDISPGHWNEQAVYDVMSRFELQRYLNQDQVIPDALSANYYDDDSESKPL
ncbi:unnamed protein product [Rhizoctonia solani]|uniref:PIN domain-like protein n=1 Tax=Rhizoctonia solani TaxID=456999 RepID=A0A8H3DD83_9AGAM|nr:unnamed protein product [Rhizoctonia solani]